MEEARKQVEQEIALISRQIDEMDSKIRAYLADRKNRPHPRHFELIDKVQGYRIPNKIMTKHLSVLLDNLQWKLHYSKQAWQQLWDNAESLSNKTNFPVDDALSQKTTPDVQDTPATSKAQYSLDALWEIQQEKLRAYGATDNIETKADFKKRMIHEYKVLNQERLQNQEIIMIFDTDSGKCRLDVKK